MQTLGSPVGVAGSAGHCLQSNFCGSPPSGFSHSFVGCSWGRLGHLLFKVSTSPTPLSSSRSAVPLTAPRLLDSLQAWGGAEGLCFLKTTLSWEFPVAISHGQAPSSRWKRRHPRPQARRSHRHERGRERSAQPPTRAPLAALAPPPQVPPQRARMLDSIPTSGPSFP